MPERNPFSCETESIPFYAASDAYGRRVGYVSEDGEGVFGCGMGTKGGCVSSVSSGRGAVESGLSDGFTSAGEGVWRCGRRRLRLLLHERRHRRQARLLRLLLQDRRHRQRRTASLIGSPHHPTARDSIPRRGTL